MKSFSIRHKIILLTTLSMLGSNLFLGILLLTKIQATLVEPKSSIINLFALDFLNDATIEELTVISLFLIITFVVLTYLFIRKLTNPLQELVFASNQLGSDVSSINFPMDSNDELAALAASLESMNKTIIKQNESLKNSELMNRSIMDNMSDGLITMTIDGLIHSFNNAAEKLFGYQADEIKGQSVTMLVLEPYQPMLNAFFKEHLITTLADEKNNVEMMGIRKDGSSFDMELSITEMSLQSRKSGDKRFFIGLCRNIAERKQNEMQLKQAEFCALAAKEEAEKANLAKSQFLSRMSHEFRTPLNAVLGFAQIALFDDENTPCDKSSMQSIYDAGNRLLAMVNDVLDIAMAETGEMSLVLETVDVTAIVKEVYQQTIKLAAENQNEILFSIKEPYPQLFIHADKARLKQVLFILVTNAIKFNRKPGTVTLSLRELTNNQIGISVKDQGDGITKEDLELIFKPFERLNAYSMGIDGLGIGLAIAKQLTEAMQGTIGVESVEKVGSRFYVIFPTCQSDGHILNNNILGVKKNYSEIDLTANKIIRILCIENDAINLSFMQQVFSKQSTIEFIPANNPVAGINLARKCHPNLILLDLDLADSDGFEVFECLKSYQNIKEIPVIAIADSAIQKDIDRAMQAGAYAYLVKPVKTEELYKTILEALD